MLGHEQDFGSRLRIALDARHRARKDPGMMGEKGLRAAGFQNDSRQRIKGLRHRSARLLFVQTFDAFEVRQQPIDLVL